MFILFQSSSLPHYDEEHIYSTYVYSAGGVRMDLSTMYKLGKW